MHQAVSSPPVVVDGFYSDGDDRTAPPAPPASPPARRPNLAWARQAWWVEILTIGFGYFLYELVQGAAPWRRGTAFADAGELMRWEHWLHLNPELSVDHAVNAWSTLAVVAGYYYDSLHYVLTPAVLLWLWLCHPSRYGRWRSGLIIASVGSLVVFWMWPLAPPRLALPGITDTLAVHHILGSVETHSASSLVNDFAAMPSLHVGWALWCAAAVAGTAATRWRHLAWLYPLCTTLVVLGTGNHYLLDAVGGLAVIAVGLALTADRPRRVTRIDAQAPSTRTPTGISAR